MVLSLVGFMLLFAPLAKAYLSPPQVKDVSHKKGFFITIPKIHAQAAIVEQVDPFDERVYKQALKKGVAHAKGTVLPEDSGTIFLFAHSSGMPWELTWSNTIFLRLNELNNGDEVQLTREGKEYRYRVVDKKIVWPSEVGYLQNSKTNQLILQTCHPIGASFQRLLVFTHPI